MSDGTSWEDYIKNVKEEARQEGKREGELIAKVLVYRDWDVSIPTIAKRCKISEEEVEKIIAENDWGMLKEEP